MNESLYPLLLSAGYGTRLRPITIEIPKCLIQIAEKPLLAHWLLKMENLGCKEVLINTHYLSEKVEDFLHKWNRNYNLKIKTTYEPKLLGTAGTLLANKEKFIDKTGMLIHADNITNNNLKELLEVHKNRPKGILITMLTFNSFTPQNCGIVETDSNDIVINFHEKVNNPPSSIANAAIYVFDYSFIEWLSNFKKNFTDFSTEVIPLMMGKIKTHHISEPYFDIGTLNSLKQARNFFKKSL